MKFQSFFNSYVQGLTGYDDLENSVVQESTEEIFDFDKIIESLRKKIETVPSFNEEDLFDSNREEYYNISFAIQFFEDLKLGYKQSSLIRQRVREATPFPENPIHLYKKLNAPGHPVRDGFILLGRGLLT